MRVGGKTVPLMSSLSRAFFPHDPSKKTQSLLPNLFFICGKF